ncbi:hypothetical protein BaRGS_00037393 [Batillaria attramentaria]|uniref:Uncharacterized protein n=1 Tax=Batillaria attramentaria TaxID=370345 RepID=A0ABD0J8T6_9CAEN
MRVKPASNEQQVKPSRQPTPRPDVLNNSPTPQAAKRGPRLLDTKICDRPLTPSDVNLNRSDSTFTKWEAWNKKDLWV